MKSCVFSPKSGTFSCFQAFIFPPYPPSGPGGHAPARPGQQRRVPCPTDTATHPRRVAATEPSEVDGSLQACRHGPSTSPFGFSGCHPTHGHGQNEQHVRAGQATENHRDHRVDLAHPDCLCALCALCGKPHGPRGTAHPTVLQAPLGRHPDRRAEGPEWRDPFKQHFHKAPDAMTQLHERCRCATLTNGFLDPRCFALLRTASLGMTVMGSPLRGVGWHAHPPLVRRRRMGMSWRCRGRSSSHGHAWGGSH